MTATSTNAIWQLTNLFHFENDFFRPQEKQQMQNAYKTFLINTKSKTSNFDENLFEEDNVQMLLQSKIQLFQLFIRTQPVNIRNFNLFHQHQQRIFVERLFYLVLNNVELTHFSTFNINSIINISKELERYQYLTNKLILNTGKLNTIIQFVLSFSSTNITSFQLNNLFYLLLNDMNEFSGKIIDRIAELLRIYHTMTYGHAITKQYLITTINQTISTVHLANPIIYPLYENFLNSSYVYKGPLILISNRKIHSISLYTIIQNLSIILLGLTVDDFEYEDKYLSFTSEQCYQIRLTIRHVNCLYKQYRYTIEYPLKNVDKQILIHLIHLILFDEKTSNLLKNLLNLYMKYTLGFSQTKIKQLLYDLLRNSSLKIYIIETIRDLINFNRLESQLNVDDLSIDDCWLTNNQIRLITHQFYTKKIYNEIVLPILNGNCREKQTIDNILIHLDAYFDNKEQEQEQVINVQELKNKLTIIP